MSAGTRIFGIAASENRDKSGELIRVAGIDDSNLRYFNDEHAESTSMNLGVITAHAKIFSEKDCKNPKQLKCWNQVRVPFVYVEGELFDATDHPFAQAAASIIKFANQNPEYKVPIGLSIEGGIVERKNEAGVTDKEGKILVQTVATKATITVKPCNPNCGLWLDGPSDLRKSMVRVPPPPGLEKLLKSEGAKTSFREERMTKAVIMAKHLKKSLDDYLSGFTSMKCIRCGHGHRFFKDSKDLPNHCNGCGFTFTLRDIWGALNR